MAVVVFGRGGVFVRGRPGVFVRGRKKMFEFGVGTKPKRFVVT